MTVRTNAGDRKPMMRPAGVILCLVIWLFLASSIVLEQGDAGAAQWGTGMAIGVAALFALTVLCRSLTRALVTGIRHGWRAIARRIRNQR